MDYFNYHRRKSSVTRIGNTPLGGENPVRIQSMTNTRTQETLPCVEQSIRIIDAGADYVRLTAQGTKEAENPAQTRIPYSADCRHTLQSERCRHCRTNR